MGALGDQLKKLRATHDLSQVAAARRARISQQMWSKLETGTASAEDSVSIYKIAEAFDMQVEAEGGTLDSIALVPKRALGPAEEAPPYGAVLPRSSHLLIPQLALRGSMGLGGVDAPDHVEVVESIRVHLPRLKREVHFTAPDNLRIITGYGDSMQPTFNDGDPLLIDVGVTDIRVDGVYVLERERELFIKRVQRQPIDGTLKVISDNKNYESFVVKDAERTQFRICGRVLLAWNSRKL